MDLKLCYNDEYMFIMYDVYVMNFYKLNNESFAKLSANNINILLSGNYYHSVTEYHGDVRNLKILKLYKHANIIDVPIKDTINKILEYILNNFPEYLL